MGRILRVGHSETEGERGMRGRPSTHKEKGKPRFLKVNGIGSLTKKKNRDRVVVTKSSMLNQVPRGSGEGGILRKEHESVSRRWNAWTMIQRKTKQKKGALVPHPSFGAGEGD